MTESIAFCSTAVTYGLSLQWIPTTHGLTIAEHVERVIKWKEDSSKMSGEGLSFLSTLHNINSWKVLTRFALYRD